MGEMYSNGRKPVAWSNKLEEIFRQHITDAFTHLACTMAKSETRRGVSNTLEDRIQSCKVALPLKEEVPILSAPTLEAMPIVRSLPPRSSKAYVPPHLRNKNR